MGWTGQVSGERIQWALNFANWAPPGFPKVLAILLGGGGEVVGSLNLDSVPSSDFLAL